LRGGNRPQLSREHGFDQRMRKLRIVIRNATGCARIELCSRLQHTFHMWNVALDARLGQSCCGFREYALELKQAWRNWASSRSKYWRSFSNSSIS
jgi:hypothetical protein